MVAFASPLFFFAALASVALSTPLVARTVSEVKADIADISAKVTTLDNTITAFPLTGGSLIAALGIHTSATTLITTLQRATSHVAETGPVDEIDGGEILSSVLAFEPKIQHALTEIVLKKPAFKTLPIGNIPALIYQDLQNLKTNTVAFADGLIPNAPESLTEEATALRDGIVTGFDVAIAGYAP